MTALPDRTHLKHASDYEIPESERALLAKSLDRIKASTIQIFEFGDFYPTYKVH